MRRLSRREGKELTRKRLVDGAIALMRSDGVAAATTRRIAEAAGIAQSSFYGHFADRDACLREAATKIGNHVLRRLRDQRLSLDLGDSMGAIRAAYATVIDSFLSSPELSRIFLRHRADDASPLGATFRALVDQARGELQIDFHRHGLTRDVTPLLDVYADLLIGATLGVVESLLDGRISDRGRAVDALAQFTHATFVAALARKDAT